MGPQDRSHGGAGRRRLSRNLGEEGTGQAVSDSFLSDLKMLCLDDNDLEEPGRVPTGYHFVPRGIQFMRLLGDKRTGRVFGEEVGHGIGGGVHCQVTGKMAWVGIARRRDEWCAGEWDGVVDRGVGAESLSR